MKASYKIKAVIVFYITVCILGRGSYPVYAKNSTTDKSKNNTSYVVVCGVPIGIRLKSHGVIVTGFMGFTAENNEYISPAKEAGIKEGDRIIAINDFVVEDIDDMQMALDSLIDARTQIKVENSEGISVKEVKLCRDSETNELKLGIWGRDGVSGIGTLTYYNEKNKSYGALGHAISDGAEPYCISGGSITSVELTGIKKGVAGAPGELRGYFKDNEQVAGDVYLNCDMGIFGHIEDIKKITNSCEFCKMAVADSSQVHKGCAYIMTSAVDGSVKKYSIEITQINKENDSGTKCFNIKVTDSKLIEASGGIVQGMSGSPIVQDGKLVGAVTHVMVNDPARGYGIFIENMLEAAG